jgi:hypothetical protein
MNNSALRSGVTPFCPKLLGWGASCCIIASGCVTRPPSHVQIQAPNAKSTFPEEFEVSTCLRVTTFNVWGLPSWLNGASSERYSKIANELEHLRSDVVLLQEVWTHRSFAELSEASTGAARTWWTAAARHKGSFLGQNGLLTLSSVPSIKCLIL